MSKFGKCLKCNGEKDKHGCPRCDDPVARAERLREYYNPRQRVRFVRGGSNFRTQALRYGRKLQAEGKLPPDAPAPRPLSGQDAAMPPGDRE